MATKSLCRKACFCLAMAFFFMARGGAVAQQISPVNPSTNANTPVVTNPDTPQAGAPVVSNSSTTGSNSSSASQSSGKPLLTNANDPLLGAACSEPGATKLSNNNTDIISCMGDGFWHRGGTSGVNLNNIPTCVGAGNGLQFDGTNFTCVAIVAAASASSATASTSTATASGGTTNGTSTSTSSCTGTATPCEIVGYIGTTSSCSAWLEYTDACGVSLTCPGGSPVPGSYCGSPNSDGVTAPNPSDPLPSLTCPNGATCSSTLSSNAVTQ